MVEKLSNNDNIKRRDLDVILEVNKKAIEIEADLASQNEEIIGSLADIKKSQESQEKMMEKLKDQAEETNKDLFKIQILFVTGLMSLLIQIIRIFVRK